MSGQFEQRRLGRPSYQLDVLDAFCGEEQLRRRREARIAWRELAAARKRYEELTLGAAAEETRLRELAALVEATEGFEPGAEDALRAERERLRHVTELAEGAQAAAEALAPEEGEGATGLTAAAERSLAPLERLAPELARAGEELRDLELRAARARLRPARVPLFPGGRAGPCRARRGRAGADQRCPPALRRRGLRRPARAGRRGP